MDKLWSLVCILDLFKKPLHLTIDNQELTSTKFGLLLSSLIYGFLTFMFVQSDFFLKAKPTILSELRTEKEAPLIQYKGFPLAFAIKDRGDNIVYDERIYSINVEAFSTKKPENSSQEEIIKIDMKYFHICNESDTQNDEYFGFVQKLFCLNDNFFEIQGFSQETTWQMLKISVLLCENSTEKNNNSCKSPEEISKFFEMENFQIVYGTPYFQPRNYEKPIENKLSTNLYKLDAKISKLVKIFLQKLQIITDDSVIFENQRKQDSFLYEKEDSEVGLIQNSNEIFTIMFLSSHTISFQTRLYQTLIESIAVLGGMLNILVTCGLALSKLEKSVFLTVKIMNFLYSFQKDIDLQDKNSQIAKSFLDRFLFFMRCPRKEQENKKDLTIKNSKYIRPLSLLNETYGENELKKLQLMKNQVDISVVSPKKFEKFKKENNNKNNLLYFDFLQYLRLIFKQIFFIKTTIKEKIFLKAKQMYERETDLVAILKKVQDVEKLKFILLNEKQIALFDLLEKPMVFIGEERKMSENNSNLKNNLKNFHSNEKGYNYYLELEKKQVMDQIDRKLFILVNSKFKNFKKYFKN